MSTFAESIKRLFDGGKISSDVVFSLLSRGILTEKEYYSILGASIEPLDKHSTPDGISF